MASQKIFIGIVTHEGEGYCLGELAESLRRCTYPNKEILLVDNSAADEYSQRIAALGLPVVRDTDPGATRIDRIIHGRNLVRDYFLKSDADLLFFLDSDVIMRPNHLERLSGHDKDVIAGLYFSLFERGGRQKILPVAYVMHDARRQILRQLSLSDVRWDKLLPIACAGLGCTLIARRVMEKIAFRNIGTSTTGGEDAAFYKDARREGFICHVDTSVKCLHMKYPRHDPKNKMFAWP